MSGTASQRALSANPREKSLVIPARATREPEIHFTTCTHGPMNSALVLRTPRNDEVEKSNASRDDVRRDLILDEGDAIAQVQLALLQSLHHQQIRRRRLMQRIDGRIEIAVLLLQPCKLCVEFALIFVGHGCALKSKHGEVVVGPRGIPMRKYPPSTLAAQVKTVPYARSITDRFEIVAAPIRNPHRQMIWLVYTCLS